MAIPMILRCGLAAFVVAAGLAAPAAEALYFGDLEGTVEIPADTFPKDSDEWTIECRFKLLAMPRQPLRLVSQWNDQKIRKGRPAPADRGRFHLSVGPVGRITFGFLTADGTEHTVTGLWDKLDGTWHHAAVTWNKGQVKVLLDGEVVEERSYNTEIALAATELPLVVGHKELNRLVRDKPPPLFDGFISEVSIWKVAREADAIVEDLTTTRVGDEAGLVACYPLLRSTARSTAQPDEIASAPLTFAAPITLDDVAKIGSPAEKGSKSETKGSQPDMPSPGLPQGVADAGIFGGLARAGWYETPVWSEPNRGRPWLHFGRHDLSAQPEPMRTDDTEALPAFNSHIRRIVANDKTQQAGVLWQDPHSRQVYVTWVESDLSRLRCASLPTLEKSDLVAATWAPAGHLYYLMIEPLPGGRPESEVPKSMIRLVKPDGELVCESPVDMGPGAFSWYTPYGRGNMAYANGGVSVILPRTFCNGDPTGKAAHHQGAVTATFTADLSRVAIFGNSASHSLGNILSSASTNDPLGLELGDCFPRSLQLHKFMIRRDVPPNGQPNQPPPFTRVSKTIYNYICHQITIGEPGKEMKVSHDGNTYTELGGVAEGQLSYSVVFAADRSPEGRTLDYDRVGKEGDPRDLALLRVVKNFEAVPGGYDVQDALMVPSITPDVPQPAPVETGEFRVFTGEVCRQRNTGLIWLTNYGPNERAHAPHIVRRRDGNVLVIWEKTGGTEGGRSLWAMVIQESGQKVVQPVCLGVDLEMDREDPVVRVGNRAYFLARDRRTNAVQLCWFLDR